LRLQQSRLNRKHISKQERDVRPALEFLILYRIHFFVTLAAHKKKTIPDITTKVTKRKIGTI